MTFMTARSKDWLAVIPGGAGWVGFEAEHAFTYHPLEHQVGGEAVVHSNRLPEGYLNHLVGIEGDDERAVGEVTDKHTLVKYR